MYLIILRGKILSHGTTCRKLMQKYCFFSVFTDTILLNATNRAVFTHFPPLRARRALEPKNTYKWLLQI